MAGGSAGEGKGEYRFYEKGSEAPVVEDACWRSVALHGAVGRLVVTCTKENIEH